MGGSGWPTADTGSNNSGETEVSCEFQKSSRVQYFKYNIRISSKLEHIAVLSSIAWTRNSNSTTFDQFIRKLQNNLQLTGDILKNYKFWYVWEGEKYEISEKDEYNYLIQGTVLRYDS